MGLADESIATFQSDRRTYIQQDGFGNDKAHLVSYTTAVTIVWPFL